jgi:hypothetical protein
VTLLFTANGAATLQGPAPGHKERPLVSKKDYVQIAAALKVGRAERGVCLAVANVLKLDNVAFSLHTFMAACGHPAVVNVKQSAEPLAAGIVKAAQS